MAQALATRAGIAADLAEGGSDPAAGGAHARRRDLPRRRRGRRAPERLAERVLAGARGPAGADADAPEWPPVPAVAAPGRRAQHLPAAQRHPVRRARPAAHLRNGSPRRRSSAARRASRRSWPRACSARTRLSSRRSSSAGGTVRRGLASMSPAPGCAWTRPLRRSSRLTSDRRAEILVGPAGSGKTRTAAHRRAVAAGRDGRGLRPDHVAGRAQRAARRRGRDWPPTPRSSSATCAAGGEPAAPGRSGRARC